MGRSRPTPPDVMVRRQQAVQLRLAGAGYAAIAQQLGYAGPSGAYAAVRDGLKEAVREPAQEVLDRELERLDAMQMGLWPHARKGEPGAVAQMLRVMERRARYLGLDHADGIAERQVRVEEQQVHLLAAALEMFARALGHDPAAPEVRAAARESLLALEKGTAA